MAKKYDNMDYVNKKNCMTLQDVLPFMVAILISLMATISLTSCSGTSNEASEEDQQKAAIETVITDEFNKIKNFDQEFLSQISESVDMTQLEVYGIDAEEFMKSYYGNFDFEIDSITITGDTAQAQVTMTNKSFTGFQTSLDTAVTEFTSNTEELAKYANDSDALDKKIGEIVKDAISDTEVTNTDPITLDLTKSDGTWQLSSSASTEIAQALMTN